MATLRIYPGSTGMHQSLEQIEGLIAEELCATQRPVAPREAIGMLQMEQEHLAGGRRLADLWSARALLQAHLDAALVEQSIAEAREQMRAAGARSVPRCGWRWTHVQLVGGLKLRLESPYVRARHAKRRSKRGRGGSGCYALLCRLGVQERLSPASRSELSRLTVLLGSYAEAHEQLGREGLQLDRSNMVRCAVQTGNRAVALRDKALEQARRAPLPRRSALAGKRVRLSLDGGRARVRRTQRGRGIRPGKNGRRPFELEWLEPRVLTIDVLDEKGKPLRCAHPLYEVSLGTAEQTMTLLVGTLRLLGVHLCSEVVFLADGAEWIWCRIGHALLEAGVPKERLELVLDYYHVTEHLWEALAACKNLSGSQRQALFEELRRVLLEPHGAQKLIERLEPLARGRRGRVIARVLNYFEAHLPRMRYAKMREKRLSIGSGVVESAVRRLINLRFKGASICWRADHLEPLLYLRAILKAGHWDRFFESVLQGRHWLASDSMLPPSERSAA